MGQVKLEVQPEYIETTRGWYIDLTELHISYNCIIQNLSFLLNMPNLETFTMEHCCNVDAQTAVQAFKKLPKPKENCLSLSEQLTKDSLKKYFVARVDMCT